MTLLLLEALAALAIGVFIVWWTMFSGRPKQGDDDAASDARSGEGARHHAQRPGDRAGPSNDDEGSTGGKDPGAG
jgi:nitrogen fixation-related uncharacterized protein